MTLSYMEFECQLCKKRFPKQSRCNRRLFCDVCKIIRHAQQSKVHAERLKNENRIRRNQARKSEII